MLETNKHDSKFTIISFTKNKTTMKAKVLSIVALLLMAVSGAWAQSTYTVTVLEGTEDADKWSADPNPAQLTTR